MDREGTAIQEGKVPRAILIAGIIATFFKMSIAG
jgi:hypothetical protein